MSNLLNSISNIVGLNGAYLFTKEGELIESISSEKYQTHIFLKIIQNILKISTVDLDIILQRIDLFGSEGNVALLFLENHYLITIFEKSINIDLVNDEIQQIIMNINLL